MRRFDFVIVEIKIQTERKRISFALTLIFPNVILRVYIHN